MFTGLPGRQMSGSRFFTAESVIQIFTLSRTNGDLPTTRLLKSFKIGDKVWWDDADHVEVVLLTMSSIAGSRSAKGLQRARGGGCDVVVVRLVNGGQSGGLGI
ncbi:hypothetical protein Hanom_Chr03g00259781 [Helianthus anomalus]